jgi:Tfp pilus assembly protein PilO
MFQKLRKFVIWRMLIIIVVLIAAGFISYYGFFDMVQEAASRNQELRGHYEAMAGANYSEEKLTANYYQIQADLEKLYGVLPESAEIFKVIDQLEKIASRNNLVGTIEVSDLEESVAGFSGIPIRIQLRGSQTGLQQYLTDLENLRYYVQEKSLEYDKKYSEVIDGNIIADGINATLEVFIITAPK